MLITIAICTRQRPWMLRRALNSLVALQPGASDLQVLVVENDAMPHCRDLVLALAPTLNIRYVLEPAVGIVHARNRVLAEVDAAGANWLASFDDDQIADPGWIRALEAGIAAFPTARILGGPCIYEYPPDASEWIVPVGYRARRFGAHVEILGAGNALIGREIFALDAAAQRFDPAFQISGGEDTEFFMRQARRGVEIRWLPDARVYEPVTQARCTLAYTLGRKRRAQGNLVRIRRRLFGRWRGNLESLQQLFSAVVLSLLIGVPGVLVRLVAPGRGRRILGRALVQWAKIRGIVDGFTGRVARDYETVDGA